MRRLTSFWYASALFLAAPGPVLAQDATITMGTKETPPFAMRSAEGVWTGISIDIWERVADQLGVTTEYVEAENIPALLEGVASGRFDMAVSAISVTAEREAKFDFSYPYYFTGLAIAVHNQGGAWLQVLRGLLSLSFWRIVGALVGVLFLVGALMWLAERRGNPDHFGGRPHYGIGSGFWWAAVTMTTVGYGDKSPRTTLGRTLALFWMFAAVLLISVITASITSTLTVSRLGSPIKGPDDLASARIACVSATIGEAYLEDHGLSFRAVDSLPDAMDLVAERKVDCVVHDEPLLKYLVRTRYQGRVSVLPGIFDRQEYAIVMPEESAWVEGVDYTLLKEIQSDWWGETLDRYLGK